MALDLVRTDKGNVKAIAMRDAKAEAVRRIGLAEYERRSSAGYQHAAALFRTASDAGNVDALVNLGGVTLDGLGVARDPAEAARLFELAAARGNPDARRLAGKAYEKLGELAEARNDPQALDYYLRAQQAGDPLGQFRLGLLYEQGRGVSPDHDKAMELIRQAAGRNVPEARQWLEAYSIRTAPQVVTPPPPVPPQPPQPPVRPPGTPAQSPGRDWGMMRQFICPAAQARACVYACHPCHLKPVETNYDVAFPLSLPANQHAGAVVRGDAALGVAVEEGRQPRHQLACRATRVFNVNRSQRLA